MRWDGEWLYWVVGGVACWVMEGEVVTGSDGVGVWGIDFLNGSAGSGGDDFALDPLATAKLNVGQVGGGKLLWEAGVPRAIAVKANVEAVARVHEIIEEGAW